jgi:lipoate-protein ligase A
MKYILSDSHDCHFNIASEEYLLRNFDDDIFMLYINESSVIVGKHQNAFAELNYWYVHDHQINVVRRLSGGGTVFHDLGNLNFCFIRAGKEGNLVDFRRFTQPIVDVLRQMGVPAEYSGRNDLLVDGMKFSGNAEHVFRNRTLHHGTILYSSHLVSLSESLKVKQDRFQDRAVRSVRSKVTNISDFLKKPLTVDAFAKAIGVAVAAQFNAEAYHFSDSDLVHIQTLIDEKYSRWDWNWGYSPRFTFEKKENHGTTCFDVKLEIEKGIIKSAQVVYDGKHFIDLENLLFGELYQHEQLQKKISASISEFSADTLLRALF